MHFRSLKSVSSFAAASAIPACAGTARAANDNFFGIISFGTLSASLIAASRTSYDIIGRDIEDDVGTTFSGTSVSTWVMAKTTTYTPTSKVASMEDGDLRTTTTTYDNDDRTNIVTDPIGRQKQFMYDPVGNTILEIRALGTSLQENYASYTYGPDGEKTSVADADNPPGCMVTGSICHVTLYAYDGFNRLATTIFPDSSVAHPDIESLGYDLNSNILTRVNRAGQTLTYTFDVLNRQLTKVVPAYGSTAAETFTTAYDLGGRVDSVSDTPGDNIASTYDTAGRQTATATTIAGISGALTASYTLDANSNRTKLAWPDGYYVGYCYDPLNRMNVAMADSTDPACATNVLATYTYDPYSRRTNLAYGASAAMAYGYTPAGDLTNLTDTQNTTPNSVAFTLGYTNAHQLASEAFSNSAFVQNGSVMGTTAYAPVNVLNQYTNVTPVSGSAITPSYDGNGNLTGDGTYTFAYDPENRLVTAAKSSLAAVYAYDPLGRREEKSGTGVTATVFLQDGSDEIAEYNTSGTLQRRFVPGPAIDDPIAMVPASGTTELFYTDHHGSVVATSDASGNLVEGPFSYDAYGDCYLGSGQATPCSTVASGEPFKYTGQYFDAETGCYYYRARYYCADPVRGGRFLQTDPVGYKDDLNLYTYVGNDPTDRTDPTGQCDDVSGCNPVSMQQENNPDTHRAEVVTTAVVLPVVAGTAVATVTSPGIAAVAISTGAGGSISAANSAVHGNSNGQVVSDTGKGMVNSAITSTAGRVGGVAGPMGTVAGEVTGAYAAAKATGASDTEATISAVAAGVVGLVTAPAGPQASTQAASVAATTARALVKSLAKTEVKTVTTPQKPN